MRLYNDNKHFPGVEVHHFDFVPSYIGGDESEGHFTVINEACSMLVRCCLFVK